MFQFPWTRGVNVWNLLAGGHINPAVTFGLFLARKLSLTRALFYMIMQCLGAICGAGVVKGFLKSHYQMVGGGVNFVNPGYTIGDGLGAEIMGTFILVYTVFSATDAKRSARDSHVPVSPHSPAARSFSLPYFHNQNSIYMLTSPLYINIQILAPLPIGFAVFLVHLATIPITGTGINPARSLGAAIIYNRDRAWDDHVSLETEPKLMPRNPAYFFCFLLIAFVRMFFTDAVDFLGGTVRRGSTGSSLPPSGDTSHAFQIQVIVHMGSSWNHWSSSFFFFHFLYFSFAKKN